MGSSVGDTDVQPALSLIALLAISFLMPTSLNAVVNEQRI